MSIQPNSTNVTQITRREAIARASLLFGAALSTSQMSSVVAAAQAAAKDEKWKPKYLNRKQMDTVAALAERILPRTDTPGAIDVGVPKFIDIFTDKYLTAAKRDSLVDGLANLDKLSKKAEGKRYADLDGAQQDEILSNLAQTESHEERTFLEVFRELAFLGYFTSEEVGRNVLVFDPIPGMLNGCVPLEEATGGRAWTI